MLAQRTESAEQGVKILYHHRIKSRDGQFVHLSELIKAFSALGHSVTLVGPRIVDEEPFGAATGWLGRLKRYCPQAIYEALELCYSLIDFIAILYAIRRHAPDFIYERYNLFLPSGVWAARLSGIPLVLEVNAPLAEERSRYGGLALGRLARRVEHFTWTHADAVLPVTEVLAQILERQGVDRNRMTVIRNGVNCNDVAQADSSAKAASLGIQSDEIVLGFVGFLRAWHGLDRVVRLLTQESNDNIRLVIVGDGPARPDLEKIASDLNIGDRMIVTGVVPRDDILDYVARFDVALQPDVVDYASPLKLVEYLALGKPTIAPDKANIREFITHGENGWLFSTEQPAAFGEAVARILAHPELRRSLAQAAAQSIKAQDLTWSGNARRITELGERLIRDRRANG